MHCTDGASYDHSDGQEKIENHMLDFVKNWYFSNWTYCSILTLFRSFLFLLSLSVEIHL